MRVKTVVTGVGGEIRQLIAEGVLTNKQILERVKANHPLRKTTYACVAWYQSKMKAEAVFGEAALNAAKAKREADEIAANEWAKREADLLVQFEADKKAADELAASKKKGR